ncbi:hypothetical protein BAE42_30775 [Mesorhizobium loti]|nr:hypothetical protein BAE42_30775 [Mesorhizobium loti]
MPDRLIEHLMPWSVIRRWNCSCIAILGGVMQQAVGLAPPPDPHVHCFVQEKAVAAGVAAFLRMDVA